MQKHCTNEHVEPLVKERDDAFAEQLPEVLPPLPDYPPQLSSGGEPCDAIAIEGGGVQQQHMHHHEQQLQQNIEEQLEPGTQRQYSLNDFELIRVIGRGSYAKVRIKHFRTSFFLNPFFFYFKKSSFYFRC